MMTLLIAGLSAAGFVLAYHTYGRWLGRRLFRLSADAVCPSVRLRDGTDYVPTPKSVVFGHHFTSIAGTGPIVGPALAITWGWLPALLWVVLGSVFIGAVHDLGALVVSLRNDGQTVGDVAGRLIGRRVRVLFLCVLAMALTVVLAIFGLVIANVFRAYPAAIFPCVVQVPLAMAIGWFLYRRGGGLLGGSLAALVLMYLSVFWGDSGWLHGFNQSLAGWSLITWVGVLLAYAYVASVLPVWLLLQPRDYINSLQLISALGLVVMGLATAAVWGGAPPDAGGVRPTLEMVAPVVNGRPEGAPAVFPFLFITVACGAISGFHCLVSSGTTSKQLRNERDAQFVGYGAMLTEGFLAVLVILACAAGIGLGVRTDAGFVTGVAAWSAKYSGWGAASAGALGAFVEGSANFLRALGFSPGASTALMGVLVASFAGTTMDTACRLQRYVIQELATTIGQRRPGAPGITSLADRGLAVLRGRHGATLLGVLAAGVLAALPVPGQVWSWSTAGRGGLILWPLFGATNQLLGGLSFLVIAFYLWRRRLPVWFLVIPALFMLVMPAWALWDQLFFGDAGSPRWWGSGNWALVGIGLATLGLEVWMVAEAVLAWPRARGALEAGAPEGNVVQRSADGLAVVADTG